MTTIADRLAEALRNVLASLYEHDDEGMMDHANQVVAARESLAAYDASKGRDEPVSTAPQGPGAEHWKQAIDEWVDDPVDSDEIEKRANELAGGGE